jgi:hypothetical protein
LVYLLPTTAQRYTSSVTKILLPARAEPFELRMAISSGSVLDKSKGPSHLLAAWERAVTQNRTANASALVKTLSWQLRSTVNYRFSGINE